MKVTEWFPPYVKPVRAGVYQIRFAGERRPSGYCRWDGLVWRFTEPDVKTASKATRIGIQEKTWRGVQHVR